jgi:hypothetical protein
MAAENSPALFAKLSFVRKLKAKVAVIRKREHASLGRWRSVENTAKLVADTFLDKQISFLEQSNDGREHRN